MKKILILSFILLLGIVSFAQDTTVFSEPSINVLPLDDPNGLNWTETGAWDEQMSGSILGDTMQLEVFTTTRIDSIGMLTGTGSITLNFDYYYSGADTDATLMVKVEKRTPDSDTRDWSDAQIIDTLDAADWNTDYSLDIVARMAARGNALAPADSVQIAFVLESGATMSENVFLIDNITILQDTNTVAHGTTDDPIVLRTKNFEDNSLTTGSWQNLPDAGAAEHWGIYTVNGVSKAQLTGTPAVYPATTGALTSQELYVPNNAITTVKLDYDYFYWNNTSEETMLAIIDVDLNDTTWIDATPDGSDAMESHTESLNAYKGKNIKLQFVFSSAENELGDFYLTDLSLYQVFPNNTVNTEAEHIDVKTMHENGDTTVLFPVAGTYNDTIVEGFWQIVPEGWTIDSTWQSSIQRIDQPASTERNYFLQFQPKDTSIAMNEKVTSDEIAFTVPNVGAQYMLYFDWMNVPSMNAGQNTDPNFIGTGTTFDFADAVVQISTDGSTWTTIWSEDDQDLLDESAVTTGRMNGASTVTNGWTSWGDYMANGDNEWFAAAVNITSHLTGTGTFEVRFVYTVDAGFAEYAGEFAFDNFYVTESILPEFEFYGLLPISGGADFQIDYSNIPYSQLSSPVNFSGRIDNKGLTTFVDGQLTVTVDGETYGYVTITEDSWDSGWKLWPVDERTVEFADGLPIFVDSTYTIGYTLDLENNTHLGQAAKSLEDKTFTVTPNLFAKIDTTQDPDYVNNGLEIDDGTSGSVGSIFEFVNSEIVTDVKVALSAGDETQAYLTIIELENADDNAGDKVFTSTRVLLENSIDSIYTFNVNTKLDGGAYYAFMINLTDDTDVDVITEDNFLGEVVRGNKDLLYNDATNENLYMTVEVVPNVEPVIATKFANNKVVVQYVDTAVNKTDSVLITMIASDENGDNLTWSQEITPAWLDDWMNFSASGDTLVLSGWPTEDDLGTTSLDIIVNDGRNGDDTLSFDLEVVSQLAYFDVPYENVDFRQFSQIDDKGNNGNTVFWTTTQDDASIFGSTDNQSELLITPPVRIPAASKAVGAEYMLSFDWTVGDSSDDSKYFIGGIAGVLGTEDANDGANYADLSVMVSTDNGLTWSAPIWKEDDAAKVAASCDEIFEGAKWGYEGDYAYTSVLSLAAYAGKTVNFGFLYETKNAGANTADVEVVIEAIEVYSNEEVEMDIAIMTDYTNIPTQHFDWSTGLSYDVVITNKGQNVPDGAMYSLSLPEQGFYQEYALNASTFQSKADTTVTFTFIPDSGLVDEDYTLTAKLIDVNGAGNEEDEKTIWVDGKVMNMDVGSAETDSTLGQYNGLGTIYKLAVKDSLKSITVNFDNTGSPFNVSIIKLEKADTTAGKVVATIDSTYVGAPPATALSTNGASAGAGAATTLTIEPENPILLDAGFYAVMINQIDADKVVSIARSDRDYDGVGFVRGDYNKLENEKGDVGYLDMSLTFTNNDAPEFVDISVENDTVYQGVAFSRTILTANKNTYGDIFIEQVLMPQWLAFVDNGDGTATISGNPSDAVPGDYKVEIRAHNRFMIEPVDFVITVKPNPVPVFATSPLTQAFEGAAYNYSVTAYDILGEAVTITVDSMPAWLTATAANDTVTLSGTPAAANLGLNWVKLVVTDALGNIAHQTFEIMVFANDAPMFVTSPVSEGKVALGYDYAILANDENGNESLVITAANVPAWLTFTDNGNGRAMLSGIVDTIGVDTVTLTVTDASAATATQVVVINKVSNFAPAFTSTEVTAATEDENYSYAITVSDAEGDYLITGAEVLPNWLTLTATGANEALLQGVPLQSSGDDTEVVLTVTDGSNVVKQSFEIAITMVDDAPVFKTAEINEAIEGQSYVAEIVAEDEELMALSYVASNLPAGLSLTTKDDVAIISGTPIESGNFDIYVTVTDGNTPVEKEFALSVSGATDVVDTEATFKLYPNPATAEVTIENAEGADVYVYSTAGALVKFVENATAKQSLDVSDLNGAYIVRVISNDFVTTKALTVE